MTCPENKPTALIPMKDGTVAARSEKCLQSQPIFPSHNPNISLPSPWSPRTAILHTEEAKGTAAKRPPRANQPAILPPPAITREGVARKNLARNISPQNNKPSEDLVHGKSYIVQSYTTNQQEVHSAPFLLPCSPWCGRRIRREGIDAESLQLSVVW